MELEEVIELGKQSNVVREIHWLSGSFWLSIVLTISILYLIYSIYRAAIKTFQTRRSFKSKTFIFHFNPISVALVCISLIFYLLSEKMAILEKELEKMQKLQQKKSLTCEQLRTAMIKQSIKNNHKALERLSLT
ncbi:hypothetical protein KLEB273_gp095 [Bacillus phage vB_BauM_KLEB27-3]|nr:hypothetical protein KLEB273_gp095 [Bacillus phage vB_BauM_KLEB27-3]